METNLLGPIRTIKALLPHMRAQGSGTIVNVTSTEGVSGTPAISLFCASKHALEGLSEPLSGELASFSIRMLIVEPGGMRTSFLDPNNATEVPISDAYKGSAMEYVMSMLVDMHGKQMLDPERSAKSIVECVTSEGEGWPQGRERYLRLPLGKECAGRLEAKVKMLQDNLDAMKGVWSTVDFDA
jgi:NAD(P)-dependent dehydrogenase (short-subunit alcohol dehydrogenase family)